MKAHPLADLFSMLPPDELEELADDIAKNGQQEPILVYKGLVIDGRNRLAACTAAGIKPVTVEFEPKAKEPKAIEDEIAALITSRNLMRRNITAGQRAVYFAMLNPKRQGQKGLRMNSSEVGSKQTLDRARFVLEKAPDKATEVLQGLKTLNAVYAELTKEDDDRKALMQKLQTLAEQAPDLAEAIRTEQMTLAQAMKENETRQDDLRKHRIGMWAMLRSAEQLAAVLTIPRSGEETSVDLYVKLIREFGDTEGKSNLENPNFIVTLDNLIAGLTELKESLTNDADDTGEEN
jgi:hypothetical protein